MKLDESRWRELAAALSIADASTVFSRLQRHYRERHRKYHNAEHVNDCLARLDEARHDDADNPVLEYALWFHDAVYNTFSKRNEEKSADWAATVLRDSGAAAESVELAHSLIMATRHDRIPTESPHRLLVDIDLSILGASRERFDEFERQIRAEYWWAPRATYQEKRKEVLRSFLDRPSIYSTAEFQERFERQARANIERSLEALSR